MSGKNDILSGKCQGILNRLKCGNPVLVFYYLWKINVICFSQKMPVLSKYLSFRECRYHNKRKIRLAMMYYMMEMLDPVREMWIHPLNVDRVSKGEFYRLYLDQRHFPDIFFQNYRMSTFQFDELLVKIAPRIMKKDTNFRKAITPEEKFVLR